MKNANKLSLRLIVALVTVIACMGLLVGCESDEVKTAKENMNNEIARIEGQIESLQEEITQAETLSMTEETPLDDSVIPLLENAISEAKTIEFTAPSTPSGLDEINSETEKLKTINYEADIQTLKDAEKAVSDSIEQMKLVTNPSEAFIIERLQGIEGVGDVSAVTEDNDPNGKLGV